MPKELGTDTLDAFVDRTHDGLEALLAALKKSTSEPERGAFLIAHDVAFAARVFGWQRLLAVAEPTALPLLSGAILRSHRPMVQKTAVTGGVIAGMISQLQRSAHPDRAGAPAILAAIAQYGAYGYAIKDAFRARVRPAGLGTRLGIVAAGVGLAAWKNPKVALASGLGGVAAAITTEFADDPRIRQGNTPAKGVGHGANLLFASEAATLLRATVSRGSRGFGARTLGAVAFSLNALGQMLVVDGIARSRY
ncbi:hypothetical protein C3B44_01065 [Corynebacterium yudongzhengii]|uniref:Uncharacterized protein n=1 Tax=Corynebacterium yudongzhengii TaxID=2080740 RepID=A0A2U1T5C4_9CORY|nr:hypothetical protein [Corynebacterium yudongzhengii]AWB81104.1 hypothetical protein C3B44_01065 [Corynebacterium yudongzhengii]PWC01204.1 hypothetical protein DF222_08465 [Corynebacterium yudongzhengii]